MTEKPDWWPNGVDPELCRECNCQFCSDLIEALEDYQEGIAPDGEHRTLEAFE